jgi:hypothetical protein
LSDLLRCTVGQFIYAGPTAAKKMPFIGIGMFPNLKQSSKNRIYSFSPVQLPEF